jgi:hypothetical protein
VAELAGQKRVIIFGGAAKKEILSKNDGLCEWLSLQGC